MATSLDTKGIVTIQFNLVDLYVKKAKEVYCENEGMPFPPSVKGLSSKILGSQDLDRALEAKKKALGEKIAKPGGSVSMVRVLQAE